MDVELTDREQAVVDFVGRYHQEWGYPPTLTEIADGIGVIAKSSAQYHVNALARKGVLTRRKGVERSTILSRAYAEQYGIPALEEVDVLGRLQDMAPVCTCGEKMDAKLLAVNVRTLACECGGCGRRTQIEV